MIDRTPVALTPPAAAVPGRESWRTLFTLPPDFTRAAYADALDWLRANGVDPGDVVASAAVDVVDDGETLYLITWQAIVDAAGNTQPCPNCKRCVAAYEVVVPLTAAIPGVVAAAGVGDTDPGWLTAVNQRAAAAAAAEPGGDPHA